MSNTIDIYGGDNSISNLALHWLAIFKDNSSIPQFDGEIEHRFQEVKDKFNELKYFILYHKQNKDIRYILDLENGFIFFNKIQYIDNDLLKEDKQNIRLIFFRRHKVEMDKNLKEITNNILYFFGFQYITKTNQNKQVLLQINSEGQSIIGV